MAKTRAVVVHNAAGKIIGISRPANPDKVVVLCCEGQSSFETEVDEDAVAEMVSGDYLADPVTRALVRKK